MKIGFQCRILLAFFVLAAAGHASAGTVRLKLGGIGDVGLDAYLTLSGSNIIQGSQVFYIADVESASFEADYGEGVIDFTVESIDVGGDRFYDYNDTPAGVYQAGHYDFRLAEMTTTPGVTNEWRFDAAQDPTPGVPDDYYAWLWNLSTGDQYGTADIGGAYFVDVAAVPIPAAAWLFASALGGLGWLRAKQHR